MKFTQERTGANVVQSFQPGEIRVRDRLITGHVILSADVIIDPWRVAEPANVTLADLAAVAALQPEVIILGTGETLYFPDPAILTEFTAKGIGIEVMDTAAACRTFNVLVHEDRAVAAALLNFQPS